MLSEIKTPPKPWSEQAMQRLRELAERPVFLVLVLLAANAVTRPYSNITHDARLYSAQVLNYTEHGAYSKDLFFRYGSQDQYSAFSMLMAPLVRSFGVELAFFLVYLACNAVFITSLVLLVGQLIEDRLLGLVALLYLAIAPLNYGGLSVFHVHESFLTPRLLSAGLVLLGFVQLLHSRFAASLVLMVLAGLLHPLMAVGGFLIWGGVFLIDKLGWRLALATVTVITLAVGAFLATPSLAGRVLGEMDDDWREAVLKPTPFNFTSEWEFGDWLNVFVCGVGIVGGVWIYGMQPEDDKATRRQGDKVIALSLLAAVTPSPCHPVSLSPCHRRAWFVGVAGLVGVAAVLGSMLAENLPYALPFQGQPYRALWILKVLQVPLCFLLADRLFRCENFGLQLLAFFPLIFLLNSGPMHAWLKEWSCLLYFLPFAVLTLRGLEQQPRRPDWLIRSLAIALVLGELFWCIYREIDSVRYLSGLLVAADMVELVHVVLSNLGVLPWMVLFLVAMASFMHKRSLGLASLAIYLAVQTAFFIVPNMAYVQENGTRHGQDILFARDFLTHERLPAGKMPTIYSPFGRVQYVWLELKMNSYFDWCQTSGVIFRRQTAMEGQRRALVVAPFEIERFRLVKDYLDDGMKSRIERFFQIGLDDTTAATVDDLKCLCAEPDLDYALLNEGFPGLYAATNGQVYIYDCRQVRARLNIPLHEPTAQARIAPCWGCGRVGNHREGNSP